MAEATDALIDKSNVLTITDRLGQVYRGLATAIDTPSTGCAARAADVLAAIMALTDPDAYEVEADLLTPAHSLVTGITTANIAGTAVQAMIQSLNAHCSQRGSVEASSIVSLDTFATYWNGAGDFSDVLYSPDFQLAYYAAIGSYLSIGNVYAPAIEQATYTNAMAKYVVETSAFTDGAAVDTTKYGMLKPSLKVTDAITQSGTDPIVITVTGVDHEGTADVDWTYTYTNPSGGGSIAEGDHDFAEVASAWIRDVTGIVVSGASAGTFYVEGLGPDSRP